MKIDKTGRTQVPQPIAGTRPTKLSSDASSVRQATNTADKVELSTLRDEVARLRSKIEEIPAVDEAKVAKVKQALNSGTYALDSHSLARAIIKNHLADEID